MEAKQAERLGSAQGRRPNLLKRLLLYIVDVIKLIRCLNRASYCCLVEKLLLGSALSSLPNSSSSTEEQYCKGGCLKIEFVCVSNMCYRDILNIDIDKW
ncbi:hypothetical protein CEXT_257911 [Caerostris extrusa]|uniref:Uncharacterized protein n=1 Tax=Caerostris extrusa TaxID=172846 RepID=A0AAV4TMG8_CAEEX|nr:hypothetical protein CEXT_257911 [Caerostris extrusa]